MEMTPLPPVNLVYSPHPICAGINRQLVRVPFIHGERIAQYVRRIGLDLRQPVVLHLNDRRIEPEHWDTTAIAHGDIITVRGVARGGGEGSDPMRTVLSIAVLLAAPTIGPVALPFGVVSGAVTTALTAIGGMLLVNALVPLPDPPDFGDNTSPTYSLTSSANRARLYQPLPLVMGTHRVVPDLGAKAYTEFEGEDQYLYQVFNFGLSDGTLSDFKIGDTPIGSFEEVEYEVSDANGDLTLFPGNVDSIAGGDFAYDGTWIERTTSVDTTAIGIDLSGLVFGSSKKGMVALRLTFEFEYRAVGSGTWLPLVTWDVENDDRTPLRLSKRFNVAQGQYDVRARYMNSCRPYSYPIIDQDCTDNGGTASECTTGYNEGCIYSDPEHPDNSAIVSWAALKSYQPDTADYTGQTRVALRIKASGQLQGQVDKFNALFTCEAPVWSGSAWSTGPTRNPAWWYLWFARGKYTAGGRRLYGVGLADTSIDIAALQAWGAWCDTKGLTFDGVIDRKMSTFKVLQLIAKCGRASPSWATGRLGVIYDDASPSTAVFGMGNIRRDSFQVSYLTGQLADEVVVEFVNPSNNWQPDTVRAPVPGVATPQNPVTYPLFGCTSEVMAGREANLIAAEQLYRRRQIMFETDMEGLAVQRGDVVTLSHDLTQWGYSGRLVSGTTDTLVLDKEVPFTPATQHYIGVRFPDGSYDIYDVVYQAGPANVITLSTPLPSSPDADPDHPPMDYMWVFAPDATPGKQVKITDIRPVSQHHVRITATDEDPAYYLAEFDSYTYVPPSTSADVPVISNMEVNDTLIRAGAGYAVRIAVVWDVAGEYGSAIIRAATHGQVLREIGRTLSRRFEFEWVPSGRIDIEVTLANFQGQYGANSRATTTYSIKGKEAPPSDVANFTAVQQGDVALLRWNPPTDIDLSGTVIKIGPRGDSSWEDSRTLNFSTKGTSVTTVEVPPGDHTLYAKHVDTSGNESFNAVSHDLNFISTYDIILQDEKAPDWLRQNWLLWSEDFSQSEWNISCSLIPDLIDGPYGVKLSNLDDTSAVQNQAIQQIIAAGYPVGVYACLSVLVKGSGGTYQDVGFKLLDSAAGDHSGHTVIEFDAFGAVTGMTGSAVDNDGHPVYRGFEFLGDGIYRVYVAIRINDGSGTLSATLWPANWEASGSTTGAINAGGMMINQGIEPGDYIKTEASANYTGGVSKNFVKHWSGVLVPASTSNNQAIGWRAFDEVFPDPAAQCIYEAPEQDIGYDDTVRVWGEISARVPVDPDFIDPEYQIDHRLAGGAYDGFEPWVIGNIEVRYVTQRLVLDTSGGVPVITGFKPTVDLIERSMVMTGVVVAPGGSAITFDRQFHQPPFFDNGSVVGGGNYAVVATNITTTGCTLNVYDNSNTSVGGTVDVKFTGV